MDWLGWLGWIVASGSLLLNIRQYLSDRHRLVVDVRYLPEIISYVIRVCNVGRRPISLRGNLKNPVEYNSE